MKLISGIEQLVRDEDRGHRQQAIIPYLTKLGRQSIDVGADMIAQPQQPLLLTVFALKPVRPAVERDRDLSH